MKLQKERELVVEYGKKMINEHLTQGTGGNISIYNREEGLWCISPSGIDYFETKPEDVVVMDIDGNIVEGNRKPSSEYEMHRLIYVNYPEANAVFHCHSTYATALSMLGEPLPACSYLIADGGGVDVRCARYETFGTKEIGEAAVEALKGRRACLLANHGQITFAGNIKSAFGVARMVEQVSETYMIARAVGKPQLLDQAEIDRLLVKFVSYGQ